MKIGVLTSGGDAPGMNPAVRGAVRRALSLGAEVIAVHEGYAGLVDGGERIVPCGWGDVSQILQRGGTALGTARCAAFRTEAGRRAAVRNLLQVGLSRLVVIGGDGSLTGADTLRAEWGAHCAALVAAGEVSAEAAAAHPALRVVGLVGSIDNDMWGTDMTIGCDSALHRIVDAVDALSATARSHQRSFVVEVMGRRCGYLALAAAACTGADYVLLPEAPAEDWQAALVAALRAGRAQGRRKSIVILAEGACDAAGADIGAGQVKALIEAELGYETRITVLGHVQRGGAPSSYDRIMSSVLGVRAAERLLEMGPEDEPILLATAGAEVREHPLMTCVRETHAVAAAIQERRFDTAAAARGPEFAELMRLYDDSLPSSAPDDVAAGRRLLVANVGAPAPGMNAAIRAFALALWQRGGVPLAAQEGLRGLAGGLVSPLTLEQVDGITSQGSTVLGTNRWTPSDPGAVAAVRDALRAHRVDGVLLVGGFEALAAARPLCEAAGLPVAVVPATISNNVPGTERSVGAETACDVICDSVDRLKQSAVGSRDRVFVVEVMGRRCGYLAAAAGVGAGAEILYTHEEGVDLPRLQADIGALSAAFVGPREVGIVLLADGASDTYDARSLARIYAAESGGRFDTRVCVLGHLQQGGRPAPRDRLAGARLAAAAADLLVHTNVAAATLLGLRAGEIIRTACADALAEADLQHRRPEGAPPHAPLLTVARQLTLPERVG